MGQPKKVKFMAQNKKVILVIMDGWGLGKDPASDAIRHARVPFVSSLYEQYPHTTLVTFGEAVGLPEGQMGNSEVGHLNLGAGRVVNQELQRINLAIRGGMQAAWNDGWVSGAHAASMFSTSLIQ